MGTARRLADLDATATVEREITIPTDRGPLSARLRTVAVAAAGGVARRRTPAGFDDPVFVALASPGGQRIDHRHA
jgi:hypothetical protein